jgi:hypothetical protein
MVKLPEINLNSLNRELDGVVQRANIGGLLPKAVDAATQFKALKESTLGAAIGTVAGGFESLTAEVDDIEGLEEAQKVASKGVALLAGNAPGLSNIVKEPSSINNDLETLAGDTIGGGLLDFKVTAPTPEAMGKALAQVTGDPISKVAGALAGTSNADPGALLSSLNDVVGKSLPVGNGFLGEVGKFAAGLEAEVGNIKNGFTGQLKNLTESLNGSLGPTLDKVTSGVKLPDIVKPSVAQLLEKNKAAEAAQLLGKFSSLDLPDIESQLGNIPVTMAEKVAKDLPLPAKSTISKII